MLDMRIYKIYWPLRPVNHNTKRTDRASNPSGGEVASASEGEDNLKNPGKWPALEHIK